MNVLEEIKSVVEVKVDIKEEALAEKLFDAAVMPLLEKAVDIIPTEIDNAYLEEKKDELREHFYKLVAQGVEKVESKIEEA